MLISFRCIESFSNQNKEFENLPNWYERTAFEGLMITQLQSTLNKQLKYRKSNLIYTCISRINDPYEQIE